MKKITAFLLVLLIIFSLSGCTSGYSEEDLSAAKQEAYDEGYAVGYDEGFSAGYSEAETAHQCEYTETDLHDANRDGYDEGYADGFADAEDEAYDRGYDDGYEDGKPKETKTDTTVSASTSTTSYGGSGVMVWIPNSGSKYHNNANCSGMKNPTLVDKEDAIAWGYTACKNCY